MRKYTEKIHAQRLLKLLERKDPCMCCPADKKYDSSNNPESIYYNSCEVCNSFIGFDYYGSTVKCPCNRIGKESIKRTWIALEEKGYI